MSVTDLVTVLALNESIGLYVLAQKFGIAFNIVTDFVRGLLIEENIQRNVNVDNVMLNSRWGTSYQASIAFRNKVRSSLQTHKAPELVFYYQ